MHTEIHQAQNPSVKAGASGSRGQGLVDSERLGPTAQQLLAGFHAGLLDTSFMTSGELAMDQTMSDF